MFMIEHRAISWWYWLVTVVLLSTGVAGWPAGFFCAIVLTVVQLLHFILRERRLAAFPVQVRMGYLLLLLVAWPPSHRWIYWIPTLGTWAQVLVGYCAMARMVSLLPWNRTEHMSLRLLAKTFLSAPVRGNILHGLPPA